LAVEQCFTDHEQSGHHASAGTSILFMSGAGLIGFVA
jgi:hypothetical protein